MKAKLEFNLPEDSCEFTVASNAMGFALACYDMDQLLRSWIKYRNSFQSADEALNAAREALHNILDNGNISLDMIE